MPSALVFDFDGVLADTERIHLAAFQRALAAVARDWPEVTLDADEYFAKYLGFDDEGVIRLLGADHGVDLPDARVRELVAEKSRAYEALVAEAKAVLYPGAEACVRRFHGRLPLAIASGAFVHEIRAVLGAAGLLPCFETIVGCGDTPAGKPAPDPYLEAARRLGVDPHRAVAIEDSRWGIQSAVSAGMTCIAVTTNYKPHELPGAVTVVPAIGDVTLELVEGLR